MSLVVGSLALPSVERDGATLQPLQRLSALVIRDGDDAVSVLND